MTAEPEHQEKLIVIHVTPKAAMPDGVGDYQQVLVSEIMKNLPTEGEIAVETADLFSALKFCRKDRATIYHFQLPRRAWRLVLWIFLYPLYLRLFDRRGQIVLTLHEWSDAHWLRRAVTFPMLYFVDLIICPTADVRESISSLAPWFPPRAAKHTAQIPIGPNLIWHSTDKVGAQDATGSAMRVGYFGFLYPKKRPMMMLEAIDRLKAEFPSIKLDVVGDFLPECEELKEEFIEGIRKMSLDQNVEFHGYIPDVDKALAVLATCDCFLLLNDRGFTERNGSILTCLQFGKPIVTTAPHGDGPDPYVGRIKEWGDAAPIVFVDRLSNAEAIAATLRQVLHMPKKTTNEQSLSSLWPDIASAHVHLYRSMTDRRVTRSLELAQGG